MGSYATIDGVGTGPVYLAGDTVPEAPGVVLLHAWWGRTDDVIAYADRLAEEGFLVLVPDLFDGRTATTPEEAEVLATAGDEDAEAIDAVVLASVDHVADLTGRPPGIVGFSFGAAWAASAPAQRDIAASVVYYGTMDGPDLAAGRAPVLGHFAQADPYEPDEGVDAFEGALRDAGRDVVINRYPGTGHWFAEPSQEAYVPDAAELAFQRTVAFLRNRLG
jgi:carboxymethylenebutenolidase